MLPIFGTTRVPNNLIYTYDFSNNSWSEFIHLPIQQIHKYSCTTRILKDGRIVVDIISTLWANKVDASPNIWTEPVDQITHWIIDVKKRNFTKSVLDVLQFGIFVVISMFSMYDHNSIFLFISKVLCQSIEEAYIFSFPETMKLSLDIT